jgi:CBS domain-containing protein
MPLESSALFIACVGAQAVTVLIMKRSILTEKVARRGYHVMREYIVNPLSRSRVEDVMQANAPTLRADMTVDALSSLLARHDPTLAEQYAWPILDSKGILVGIVTRGDLVRAASSGVGGDRSVLEAGSRSLVVTYPDELLEEAVDKMVRHDIGRLPVVDRHHPDRLVGYLGRKGIASAWREIAEEEQVREAGWLSGRARLLRMKVRRVISQEDDSERLVS